MSGGTSSSLPPTGRVEDLGTTATYAHGMGMINFSRKRSVRCLLCENCSLGDCGKCAPCQGMSTLGGQRTRKQPCIYRKCLNPRVATMTSPLSIRAATISKNGGEEKRKFTCDSSNMRSIAQCTKMLENSTVDDTWRFAMPPLLKQPPMVPRTSLLSSQSRIANSSTIN